MPLVIYGGINLPFVKTEGLRQVPEIENGMYKFTRITFAVSGVLTPQVACLPTETFSNALARIKHSLERPRQPLQVFFDDSNRPFIQTFTQDVADGPICREVSLFNIAGTQSAHISFTVEVCVRDCPNTGDPGPDWTYHAWRESIDTDDGHSNTITRTGVIRFRGDRALILNDGVWGTPRNATADAYRGLISPGIPKWFLRIGRRAEVQEDGLALRYTFTDREQFAMPPYPAVKAGGTYSLTSPNGARLFAQVSVSLTGRKDAGNHREPGANQLVTQAPRTGKGRLLAAAVAVGMDRLKRGLAPDGVGGKWLITGQIEEDLYEPTVRVQLRTVAAQQMAAQGADTFSVLTNLIANGFDVGATVKEMAQRLAGQPAADGKGVGDEVPRGMARYGFDKPPLHYDDPATDPDRGSTPDLKILAAVLNDPCLAARLGTVGGGPPAARPPTGPTVPVSPPPPVTRSIGGGYTPLPHPGGLGSTVEGVQGASFTPPLDPSTSATIVTVPTVDDVFTPEQPSVSDGKVWTHCEVIGRWHTNYGKKLHTEMRKGGKTVAVQVAAKSVTYVVEISAQRIGAPCEMPPAEHPDSNFALIDLSDGNDMDVGADGVSAIHTAAMRAEYGVLDPSILKKGSTVAPWLAELFGKGSAPVIHDGPVLCDPDAAATTHTLVSVQPGDPIPDDADAWQQELKRWAGIA